MKKKNVTKLWWVFAFLRPFSYLGRALICFNLCIYCYNEGMISNKVVFLAIILFLYQLYYVLGDFLTGLPSEQE